MEKTSNKLKAKDFITIGIFTAILFAVEFAFGMLGYIHPFIVAAYVLLSQISLLPLIPVRSRPVRLAVLREWLNTINS